MIIELMIRFRPRMPLYLERGGILGTLTEIKIGAQVEREGREA